MTRNLYIIEPASIAYSRRGLQMLLAGVHCRTWHELSERERDGWREEIDGPVYSDHALEAARLRLFQIQHNRGTNPDLLQTIPDGVEAVIKLLQDVEARGLRLGSRHAIDKVEISRLTQERDEARAQVETMTAAAVGSAT